MKIHIKYITLFDDGSRYYYNDNSGIVVSEFSNARGTSDEQEMRDFKSYSFFDFEYEYDKATTIENLVKTIMDKMGFDLKRAQEFGIIPINIFISNQLILCEK